MRHSITIIASTLMLMGSVNSALHIMPVNHPTRDCVIYHHCHR